MMSSENGNHKSATMRAKILVFSERLWLLKGKIKRSGFERKWLELAQDLLKAWIHEISTQLIEQTRL